jgi:hypothetical protein
MRLNCEVYAVPDGIYHRVTRVTIATIIGNVLDFVFV